MAADARGQQDAPTQDHSKVDAGVRTGLKLVLLAVVLLPVYKFIAWLYPANDNLVPGTRSGDLFEMAGRWVLLLLFASGILRALYAVTVERRKSLRRSAV